MRFWPTASIREGDVWTEDYEASVQRTRAGGRAFWAEAAARAKHLPEIPGRGDDWQETTLEKNVNSTLTFVTLSGELRAKREEDGIVLDFPLYPAHPQDFHEVEDLIKTAIGDTLVQDICYSPDTRKLLVRLSDTYNRSFLENLKVNTQNLLQVENTGKVKGLILTLKGEPDGQAQVFDFYSRYFAPWLGVAEDPVTGSAHTVLGSYWSQQLGKKNMHACQCSCRGGELEISLRPDGRVDIRGSVAIVLEGTLTA
nr:phenazine biosynthesis-like domain-containing protein isoform X2 [Equus asinus]